MARGRYTPLLVASAAICAVLVHAQTTDWTCGREGQTPCDAGCSHDYLPDGELPSLDWYPKSDNYVQAPQGYPRQDYGLCTRCGNMYEPACEGSDGGLLCWPGLYSEEILLPSDDGFCIPEQEQFGCGTSGKALCPEGAVAELGTLAIIIAPIEGAPWKVNPTLYEREGCIYSDHNPQLRFIPAPAEWLPENHKCASVCIHCGHVGEPPCPNAPMCHRRRSLDDTSLFMDGPIVDAGDICEPLNCGGNTVAGPLPTCEETVWATSMKNGDADGDGCAEPYAADKDGLCSGTAETDSLNPAVMLTLEDYCAHPEERLVTAQLVQTLQAANATFIGEPGGCMPCGHDGEVPCTGMDFGGCFVNDGIILDEATGLCKVSPCGGLGSPLVSDSPWEGALCMEEDPQYPEAIDPINAENFCLYFHNINTDSTFDKCEQCGWPGRRCNQECIYGIEWASAGSLALNAGRYKIRGDLRHPQHCEALTTQALYPDGCPNPYHNMEGPGTSDEDVENSTPAVHKTGPTDPTFGTEDNPDDTQHSLADVPVPFVNVCPGGGKPVHKYSQCGGADWDGPTCCYGYSVCVVKNSVFHQCEDANVPSGVIPWHMSCDEASADLICELGSTCVKREDASYCEPTADMLPGASSSSSSRGRSAGATVGIVFAVAALIIGAIVGGFVIGRRNTSGHTLLGSGNGRGFLGGGGSTKRRSKKNRMASTIDETLEATETTTLSMEDSAADEFIDMRVATEAVVNGGGNLAPSKSKRNFSGLGSVSSNRLPKGSGAGIEAPSFSRVGSKSSVGKSPSEPKLLKSTSARTRPEPVQ